MDTSSPQSSHAPFFSPHTLITGGTFTQVLGNYNEYKGVQGLPQVTKGGFERLAEACSPSAIHNSVENFDLGKCHANTRLEIIKSIMDRIQEGRDSFIYMLRSPFTFLTGAAGAGKTTIMNTIAARCEDEGTLLASFFFRLSDPTRNQIQQLFPTIAYQMCLALPLVYDQIVAAVERDPLIFRKNISAQINTLFVEPFVPFISSGLLDVRTHRFCILIDGLDECVNRKACCEMLEILAKGIRRERIPVVVIVASRPEYDITCALTSPRLERMSKRLKLGEAYRSKDDIRLYLQDSFKAITLNHPSKKFIPANWPGMGTIEKLVQKASGQFIYPATVVKYLSSRRHSPTKRLNLLFDLQSGNKDMPFAALDALYLHIVSKVEDIESFHRFLGFFWLHDRFCPLDYVYIMLQGEVDNVEPLFSDLLSLLMVKHAVVRDRLGRFQAECMLVFLSHAPLVDFLCDPARSGRYHLDLGNWRTHYLTKAFQLISVYSVNQSIYTLIAALRFIMFNLCQQFTKDEILHSLSVCSVHRLRGIILATGRSYHFDTFKAFIASVRHFLRKHVSPTVYQPIHNVHPHAFDECFRCVMLEIYLDPSLMKEQTFIGYEPDPAMEDQQRRRKLLTVGLELREQNYLASKERDV
ncbi:hypothetical protein CPC08DRAFT_713480 [Agrocybe pediades]|nr:hypothetical protein CPC08DRAFT_713480 [Agrocybe pediades]